METLLRGIPGVSVFIDDVLISVWNPGWAFGIFGGSIDEAGKCRAESEVVQVQVPCTFNWVLGASHWWYGHPPSTQQNPSDSAGTHSDQLDWAEIVYWTTFVLWQVPTSSIYMFGTPLIATEEGCDLAVDIRAGSCIPLVKGASHILTFAGPLQSRLATDSRLQRVCLWPWHHVGSLYAGWFGETYCLCIKNSKPDRMELFTDRKRRTFLCVWC